jgi:hypothetical protein
MPRQISQREFLSVHDAHCCTKHGCKYCDEDCPVVLGTEPGIFCEDCENDEHYYPIDLKRITGFTPEEFEAMKADAAAYRELKKQGMI